MTILSAIGHYWATAAAAVLRLPRSPSERASVKVEAENAKCSEGWFKVTQRSVTAIKMPFSVQ